MVVQVAAAAFVAAENEGIAAAVVVALAGTAVGALYRPAFRGLLPPWDT